MIIGRIGAQGAPDAQALDDVLANGVTEANGWIIAHHVYQSIPFWLTY